MQLSNMNSAFTHPCVAAGREGQPQQGVSDMNVQRSRTEQLRAIPPSSPHQLFLSPRMVWHVCGHVVYLPVQSHPNIVSFVVLFENGWWYPH